MTLPDDPIQPQPDYASALAAFEALPPVRILFDNGAGSDRRARRSRASSSRSRASRCRAPRRARGTWARGGALSDDKRARRPAPTGSPGTRRRGRATDFTGNTGSAPAACGPRRPPTTGRRTRPGTALSYVTAPLSADTAVRRRRRGRRLDQGVAPDVDLQVTVSEVRPDGKETFVQSGWLRGERAQARPAQEHAARAGPEPRAGRRRAAARRASSPR